MTNQSSPIVAVLQSMIRLLAVFIRSVKAFATRQFLAGVLWCVACGWVNSLSQIYVDKIHWASFKQEGSKPLPDIGFILLPRIWVSRLPDWWNAVIVLGTLVPVILLHPWREKIMRRFAAVQGTCFLLRAITIMATILPNPYDTCENMSRSDEVPVIEAFKVMLGIRITCGDVLYSGHAANFTLMALIWQEYGYSYVASSSKRKSLPTDQDMDVSMVPEEVQVPKYTPEWYAGVFFPRIFWLVAVLGYLIIIACRFHYTVDVVVAIVVVAKQWGLYHMVIRTPKLIEKVPFLQWYESKGIYGPSQSEPEEESSELGAFDQRSMASVDMNFSLTPFRGRTPISRQTELNDFGLEEGKPLTNHPTF